MTRITAPIALVVALLFEGCAASLVSSSDPYYRGSAYIYGRFLLQTDAGQDLTFVIRCRDGERYKIPFSRDRPLMMIRLPAGLCQIEDVTYEGQRSVDDMASFRLLGNEHLEPGGVYYVGDFIATGKTTKSAYEFEPKVLGFAREVRQSWKLFQPSNNYLATTADLRRAFPSFAKVGTEDRMPRQ